MSAIDFNKLTMEYLFRRHFDFEEDFQDRKEIRELLTSVKEMLVRRNQESEDFARAIYSYLSREPRDTNKLVAVMLKHGYPNPLE